MPAKETNLLIILPVHHIFVQELARHWPFSFYSQMTTHKDTDLTFE